MNALKYHEPVMLNECIEGLAINPDGIYVDATFGGGGHARAILNKLKTGKLYTFDQDSDSAGNAIKNDKFIFIEQNFRYVKKYLRYYNAIPVDGLLADLGVSSHQFDIPQRGFSIRFNADLDMRMDSSSQLTAKKIINTYTETQLHKLFEEYGEIRNSKFLAKTIVAKRIARPINTVFELKDTIQKCVNKFNEKQYMAQVFQALRIEVNNELGNLKELLLQCKEIIKNGGRLAIISYHSLEDRIVKNFMLKGNFEGIPEKDFYGNPIKTFRAINKKPITPGIEEINNNPRSRSAKLRIAEKVC